MDVASRAELLHETAEHHDRFEKAAPPHDWWDWYAAYLSGGRRPGGEGRFPDRVVRWCRRRGAGGRRYAAPVARYGRKETR